jgi:hypothetical protein
MKLERSKEWWLDKAKAEDGHVVAAGIPVTPLPSLEERDAWRALRVTRDAYDAAVLDRTMAIRLLDDMVENRAREYRAAQAHYDAVSRKYELLPASPDVPGVSAVSSSEQTTESRGQTLAPAPTDAELRTIDLYKNFGEERL